MNLTAIYVATYVYTNRLTKLMAITYLPGLDSGTRSVLHLVSKQINVTGGTYDLDCKVKLATCL